MLREIAVASVWLALAPGCAPSGMSGETGESTSSTGASAATTTGTSGTPEAPTTGTSGTTTAEATGTSTGEPAGNLFLSDEMLVIAHRGGARLRPEETLPAFEHALAVGADVLEFDVHATADGVIVAMHDATVDRTTDGTGAVKAMTLRELRALDAGYQFTPDDGATFPYRGAGLVVPTVDEILAAFPGSYYLIEIKQNDPPIVDGLLAALAEHEALERVVIAAAEPETMLAVRAAAPMVFTSLSVPEMLELNLGVGSPDYQAPARFVHPPWDLATAELVAFCHQLGLKIHPWTVNDADRMLALIDRGVDGIMTDDPALLAALAK